MVFNFCLIYFNFRTQKNNNLFNETYYLSNAYNNLKDEIRY